MNLQTDKGTEFYNKNVRNMLKQHKIHHYSTKSENKCAVLERAHRTLRERLYRVFTHRNSYKYYDILPMLVDSYNHSTHRAHGFEPAKVTMADEPELYKRLYHSSLVPQFRFAVGDIVRVSKARKTFRKGYLPGWTEETFRVYKRYPTIPPTYALQDFNSKEIDGRFYNEELQKIDKSTNGYWAIEKIIQTKGRGPSRRLFVKWVGFPDSQNSWIRADQIELRHNESECK
ncbi:putative uncharacterized transposon-derived protein F54H12.3 [Trichonephila clavipes]|uniref:Uncharacterized transposon-derived protein F54H12.3 n=2 Tax=Trichonephila clavipes TaxID=2585209 RepID=A0A8X6RN72_TRICX|nr:putative uncharacterized transposon-derived protein F54H12.3 [Trichonephila clavipes]GFX97973.1 putative uncharacterized transposon-derived protein F54H12.3 [Trichonephila clavipes]